MPLRIRLLVLYAKPEDQQSVQRQSERRISIDSYLKSSALALHSRCHLPFQDDTERFRLYPGFRLASKWELLSPIQYQVTPNHQSIGSVIPPGKTEALTLKPELNPKRGNGRYTNSAQPTTTQRLSITYSNYVKSNSYSHTLQLDRFTLHNQTDQFLFELRTRLYTYDAIISWSSWYQSAFARNNNSIKMENHIMAQQTEAHALAANWLPDRGWISSEPTADIDSN